MFTVSGSNQTFPLADAAEAAKLKAMTGQEMPLVARVQFEETPPRLEIVEEPAKGDMPGMGGMQGIGR